MQYLECSERVSVSFRDETTQFFINKDLTQHLESFLNLFSNKGNKYSGFFSSHGRGKMRRLHFCKLGSNTMLKCYCALICSHKHLWFSSWFIFFRDDLSFSLVWPQKDIEFSSSWQEQLLLQALLLQKVGPWSAREKLSRALTSLKGLGGHG